MGSVHPVASCNSSRRMVQKASSFLASNMILFPFVPYFFRQSAGVWPRLRLGHVVLAVDPVLHVHHLELRGRMADHHPLQARVDDVAAAHGAGRGVRQQLPGLGVAAHQIQRAAHHIPAAGGNDGIGLGVDAAAQLVPLPPGHPQLLPGAIA